MSSMRLFNRPLSHTTETWRPCVYLQPRHERDCWDPNCRGPIGTPMENLAKALARKPMMSTANFLEREHNRELPLRWPSFADWCFQDPYAHLDSMAPGLRTRPDTSTSEALAIVREQLRAKFAAAVPEMLWRWPRVGYCTRRMTSRCLPLLPAPTPSTYHLVVAEVAWCGWPVWTL